jgi:hypothetical protein
MQFDAAQARRSGDSSGNGSASGYGGPIAAPPRRFVHPQGRAGLRLAIALSLPALAGMLSFTVGAARADGVVGNRPLFGSGASLFSYAGPPAGETLSPAASNRRKARNGRAAAGGPTSLTALLGTPPPAASPVSTSAMSPPPIGDPANACLHAIAAVNGTAALPAGLLRAVAVVESGRRDQASGHVVPWPWTINAGGHGHFFATRKAAIDAVRHLRAAGVAPIDVGCMQIDLDHHPHAFASLEQAFDPRVNVRYGAAFLKRLHRAAGAWPLAIADYHSQTPSIGAAYAVRVLAAWQHEPHGRGTALAALSDGKPAAAGASRKKQAPAQQVAMTDAPSPAVPATATGLPALSPPPPGITGRRGRTLADYRRMPVQIAGR